MITDRLNAYMQSKIKQWPVNTNRASQLGHECVRFLVYERTKWREKNLHDVGLQYIFNEGHHQERALLRDLTEAGFDILEQQRAFEWREYQITGHIDGKLNIPGVGFVPFEIKSCSPFVWDTLSDAESLLKHKYHHVRAYPSQLTLYMLMDNNDSAVFLFKNKNNGQVKEIWLNLDYELGEKILRKAEAVNRHVAENTIPERIPYDDSVCNKCGYFPICLPEIKREALDIIDDADLELKLSRRDALSPSRSEYERIDREIKEIFRGKERSLIGDYLIIGKQEKRGWITKISKLEVSANAE